MISLIVAIAQNNVIGGDNKLLWHISDDLKRFKKITSGNTIVMGRKTFESLPGVLPNRKHIILTRDKNYTVDNPSVEVIHNINDIINNFKNSPVEVFIIGGGEIYNQFINSVDKIYLTKVFKNFEGDTTFPEIDYNNWNITFESEIFTDEKSNINYQFINLEK
ncbi:dihydrofolate reductase [Clostridium sp. NSJ-145]|uniref:dihydrofolate reductase n=1 Tax=Clostridium sp. NSJ-145 TaxID=2897777 RepID=UPI001E5A2301|nr:dihydrofolate reductase [Clostridium sp. NSJ-145]MCD2502782.1 dihydrofolate reductase [Clostridium sp. NSJ-145]